MQPKVQTFMWAQTVYLSMHVLALHGPAGEVLTTEPPCMQSGRRPSVHMDLKNLLRHRQTGRAKNTGACKD